MLAFEDIPSTITFLEYHGLQLNVEKSHVLLDRNRFRQPDTPFALDRAINIVESKRNTSVGEIVCGEPLPPKFFETHVPHNSFDEKGYLKISELPKDFQNKYQQFLGQYSEPEIPVEKPEPKKPFLFTNQPQKQTEQTEIPEKIQKPEQPQKPGGFVFKLQTETPSTISLENPEKPQELSEPDGEIQSFFGSVKNETARSQSPLMIFKSDASRSQSPLLQPENNSSTPSNNFWGKSAATFSKNIFGNTDSNLVKIIPKPPVIETPKETFSKEEILQQKLFDEKVIEEKLLQEKLIEEKLLKEKLHKQNEERIARKLFEAKQTEIKKQEQLKQKKENERKKHAELVYDKELQHQIQLVVEEVLNEVEETLIKNRLEQISNNIKMRKVLQYGRLWRNLTKISKKKRKNFFDNPVWVSTRSVQQQADELSTLSQDLTLHDIKRYKCGTPNHISVKPKRIIKKLDIYRIVWKILFEQLSTSESMNFEIFWKVGLSFPEVENEGLLVLLQACLDLNPTDLTLLKKYKCNNGGSLNVSMKKVHQNEHFNGLIYFNFDQTITQINQERFQKIIYNQKKVSIPIVVLIKSKFEHATIAQQLKLDELVNNRIISIYTIFHYTEYNFNDVLTKTLEFLAKHSRENPNKLETNELSTIFRNCLGEEFWYRIRSSMELNKRFSILLETPNNVIELYNEALKYCLKILFDSRNYDVPSFPTEFKEFIDTNSILFPCSYEYFPDYWKSPSYLNKLKKIVKGFHLPKLEEMWPPKDQHDFQQILDNYCRKIFQENTNILYKILSVVYRKCDFINVTWVDVIEIIIQEKITKTGFNDKKHPIYTLVYDSDEMRGYRRIPWWFQLKFVQKGIRQIKYVEEFPEPEIVIDVEEDSIDLDKTLTELYEKQTNEQNDRIIDECNELNMLLNDLEESMEIQKSIMKKFEEKAQMALD